MTSQGAFVLVVVCEADADRRIACGLADRVLCKEVSWIEPESLDDHRSWRGLVAGTSYLKWSETRGLAQRAGLKAHGHFEGRPGSLDAFAARRALLLIRRAGFTADAVVLVRDSDGELERRTGLEQARAECAEWPDSPQVIVGLAHPKREAWVLAGFEPRDKGERAAVLAVRKSLGFDPCTTAHELYAREPGALRDAKRVLAELTGGLGEREETCWMESRLELLQTRGGETGLSDYLAEIRERLVPLFTRRRPS
jgi:hypothetical protein